jgi:hypothetical protein
VGFDANFSTSSLVDEKDGSIVGVVFAAQRAAAYAVSLFSWRITASKATVIPPSSSALVVTMLSSTRSATTINCSVRLDKFLMHASVGEFPSREARKSELREARSASCGLTLLNQSVQEPLNVRFNSKCAAEKQ